MCQICNLVLRCHSNQMRSRNASSKPKLPLSLNTSHLATTIVQSATSPTTRSMHSGHKQRPTKTKI